VVAIDGEDDLVERARAAGLPAIRGNAVNESVLREAAPERATTALVAIPNTLEAGEIIARLRVLNPALSIVARAHSDIELKHLLEHGADAVVMAERELAHSLTEMVMARRPTVARSRAGDGLTWPDRRGLPTDHAETIRLFCEMTMRHRRHLHRAASIGPS
jgi:voltage-gated potassium channel Kch